MTPEPSDVISRSAAIEALRTCIDADKKDPYLSHGMGLAIEVLESCPALLVGKEWLDILVTPSRKGPR